MKRSLYGHTLFAVAMAIAAYVAWVQPKDSGESKKTVVAGAVDELTELRWQEERWAVRVNRTSQEEYEVTVQARKPAPKEPPRSAESEEDEPAAPDPGEGDAAAAESPGAAPDSMGANSTGGGTGVASGAADAPANTFPGSDKVKSLLEKLVPLTTRRALGEVPGERLGPMGLDEPTSQLTLAFGNREHRVDIGSGTYGAGDLYARRDGEVFLIPAATFAPLRQGANPLLDKNALGVPRKAVTRVTITAGAQRREVAQRHSENADKRFFADPTEPEIELEMVSNWLERLWRLRVVELRSEPPPAMIPPVVEVEMFAGPDESLGLLRLWAPDDRVAVATSTRFAKTVTIGKVAVEALLKDVDSVLAEER